jgi:hypothetical protein
MDELDKHFYEDAPKIIDVLDIVASINKYVATGTNDILTGVIDPSSKGTEINICSLFRTLETMQCPKLIKEFLNKHKTEFESAIAKLQEKSDTNLVIDYAPLFITLQTNNEVAFNLVKQTILEQPVENIKHVVAASALVAAHVVAATSSASPAAGGKRRPKKTS